MAAMAPTRVLSPALTTLAVALLLVLALLEPLATAAPAPIKKKPAPAKKPAPGAGPGGSKKPWAGKKPAPAGGRGGQPASIASALPTPTPQGDLPGTIAPGFAGRVDDSVLQAIQGSFVRPIQFEQVYGWITLADSKALALQQTAVLKSNLASDLVVNRMFSQYADLYGKQYAPNEYAPARQAFESNLQLVVRINEDTSLGYWAGCNVYCDMTSESFQQMVLLNNQNTKPTASDFAGGERPDQDPWQNEVPGRHRSRRALHAAWPPTDVDWVAKGVVTPIKRQWNCGSCWAHAATAAIESTYLMYGGQPGCRDLDLSEQQLVSCVNAARGYGSNGCTGGWSEDAIDYVYKNYQVTEDSTPYTASNGACGPPAQASGDWVKLGYSYFRAFDLTQDQMTQWIADRPTIIYFCADDAFQVYSGGLYTGYRPWPLPPCGSCANHAMLAVGYSAGWYKIKNSWGTGWGSNGYAYVAKNPGFPGGTGVCGIQQRAIQSTIVFQQKLANRCPSPPPRFSGAFTEVANININHFLFNSPPPPSIFKLPINDIIKINGPIFTGGIGRRLDEGTGEDRAAAEGAASEGGQGDASGAGEGKDADAGVAHDGAADGAASDRGSGIRALYDRLKLQVARK